MSRAAQSRWALAVDLLAGEPPNALHPTVWMGHGIAAARACHRRAPRTPAASWLAGVVTLGAGMLVTGVVAGRAERSVTRLPRMQRDAIGGALLKPALSLRALLAAGRDVEDALRRGALPDARRLLAWHLVSRDTSRLSASEVAGAAVESLAENLSDGLIAPLMWHALGGLRGAYVYRFVNTADAILGYRTPELEWFGKAAARTDDALNLLPARLTALLIALAAPAAGGSTRRALHVAFADARQTPSPNAGWPMAAMAGALDVRLDKRAADDDTPALYVLHMSGRRATVTDLARARRIVGAAAALSIAIHSSPFGA